VVCPVTAGTLTIGEVACQSKVTVRDQFYRKIPRKLFHLRELPAHPAGMRSPDLRAVATAPTQGELSSRPGCLVLRRIA
jgi:hypothetical protein